MPRIRWAIRSGWKYSSWSSRSPTETSLIGLPVTALTESAGVAVELRQHDAVEGDAPGERLRHANRVLAGHRVEHEQHVGRPRGVAHRGELVHQRLVHVQPAGRVEDDGVQLLRAGTLEPLHDRLDGVGALLAEDGHLDLLAELLELVDRGRALQVGGDEARLAAFLAQEQRELGRGGRLARALQAGEQDHRRRPAGEREPGVAGAHQGRQLLLDDLHDLLAGRQALGHVLAERPFAHTRDEVLHDLEVDVGLQERQPDLAHRARDRLLVEAALLAQIAERALEAV
jgi:hypothetical protein